MKRHIIIGVLLALLSVEASAAVIKTVQAGSTDQSVTLKIIDATDGTPETGVAFNTAGIDLKYWRHGANAVVSITEVTQTVNGAHTDGGFVSLGDGLYRLDLPDAAVASGTTAVDVFGTVTGMVVIGGAVQLSPPVTTVTNSDKSGYSLSSTQTFSNTGTWTGNVTGSVGSVAAGGISEASFATTAGSFRPLGIARQGTAQSATGTTLVLDSAASFGDDTPIGMTLLACGSTQGYCQARTITDFVGSTDTATVDAWTVTPSGTINYYLFGTAPVTGGGSAPSASEVAEAVATELGTGTQFTAIPWNPSWDAEVQSEATDALNAYDPPTNAELTARTLASASYATASALATVDSNVDSVLEDTGTTIPGTLATLATASALATVDTVADGIKAVTDNLPDSGALTSLANASDQTAIKTVTDKLDDTLEDNSGTYRFTESALAQAPAGEGGGGGTDWDADERTAIRTILGIPVSGSTPADPSSGILDTIRDQVAGLNDVSTSDVESAAQTGAASALSTYDPPTRAELTSDTNSVLSAVSGLNDLSAEDVQSAVASALDGETCDEPTGKPSWGTSTMKEWVCWIGAWSRNEVQQTSTTKSLRNDADNANIVTCGVSDDGTTFTLSECTP